MNRLQYISLALALIWWGGCKDDSRPGPKPDPNTINQPSTQSGSDTVLVVANITPGKIGGELDLPLVGEPRTFNPLLAHDRASETISRLLFSGLTRFNWITETPEPDLAHKWSVAEDGRTWTWQLRPGLKWSDGRPLTADDVVFTWNEIIYNTLFINPLAATFSIDGEKFVVRKIDTTTVQFVTPKPFAPFVHFVGNVPVLPRHTLRGYVNERRFTEILRLGTPAFRFAGSGPYRLNEYRPGEKVVINRNEFYHRFDSQGNRLPYLDLIRFRPMPAADDLPHRFLTNGLALAEGIRIEDLPILNEATKTNDHQVLDLGPGAEPRLLWFNQNTNAPGVAPHKKAWFREVAFRRAISLAIDRESIMRDGGGGWARGFIVAESPRWLADDTVAFPHKPAQAVNLLGQIGIKEVADGQLEDSRGNKVAFSLKLARGSATSTAVAEAIAQQLNSLGMQVTVEHVEFPALLHSIDTKSDYDAILMGFGGGLPDPHTAGDILRSDGPMHFWNPQQKNPATAWEKRIDDLFLRQRGELEFEQRKKTANEIRVILARELPFIPLFKRPQHAALRARLGNLKASATAPFPLTWNVEELFLQ